MGINQEFHEELFMSWADYYKRERSALKQGCLTQKVCNINILEELHIAQSNQIPWHKIIFKSFTLENLYISSLYFDLNFWPKNPIPKGIE